MSQLLSTSGTVTKQLR